MEYENFNRVPTNCSIWRKLAPVDTSRWLRILLNQYLDETAKAVHRQGEPRSLLAANSARRKQIESGGKMIPGEDYTPFASGVWTFGHVASEASKRGMSVAYAKPEEAIQAISDWWVEDRKDSAIKAHHIVASFDTRISKELQTRGYPVDSLLLSSIHQTLSQYSARFYPGETLGWVAGCHHDRANAHVHALVHPKTSAGTLVRMSGLKDGEQGDDKFDYLRTNFNTRSRQLFVALTQQPKLSQEPIDTNARHMMLLSRHALRTTPRTSPTHVADATAKVESWISSRDYSDHLEAAVTAANEEYLSSTPSLPDMDSLNDFFRKLHSDYSKRRGDHLDTALEAFRVITEPRKSPNAYTPVMGGAGIPLPPTESEYFALASRESGRDVLNIEDALAIRLEASEKIRHTANQALVAYRESIIRSGRDLDELRVQVNGSAAQIFLKTSVSMGVPYALSETGKTHGESFTRALPTLERSTAIAERELSKIATVEAKAHAPENPAATPGLLASGHVVRFSELASPAVNLTDHAPSL